MELPPARDIKPGLRFPVISENGTVEVRLLKFSHGKGENKHATTWDGTSKKEVVLHWPCSLIFKGERFTGRFSLVSPIESGGWAVRIEVVIPDEDFWKDMKPPSAPLPSIPTPPPDPGGSTDTYFFG